MKFALHSALIATLLQASAHGKPIVPQITVSLTNDQTGKSAQATVLANGTVFTIPELFANTNIDNANMIVASSAQLTSFAVGVFCVFREGDRTIAINDEQTFISFDSDRPGALVNLDNVTFQCEI
jgi:TPP-dependent trihydroxycyclohexane-1,2-dione (THcHDO) dehydratase